MSIYKAGRDGISHSENSILSFFITFYFLFFYLLFFVTYEMERQEMGIFIFFLRGNHVFGLENIFDDFVFLCVLIKI